MPNAQPKAGRINPPKHARQKAGFFCALMGQTRQEYSGGQPDIDPDENVAG